MRYLLLLPLLAGCATTSGGLAERDIAVSYQSTKPARDVADCLSSTVTMQPVEALGSDAYVTYRKNAYGVRMSRYDVKGGNETTVDVRSNIVAAAGLDKVQRCL